MLISNLFKVKPLTLLFGFVFLIVYTPRSLGQNSRVLFHLGGNQLWMQPYPDSSIQHFKMQSPGKYIKISGESFKNLRQFTCIDLTLSLNKGKTEAGTVKSSRINYNMGIGKIFGRLKLIASTGFCYVSVAYQNNSTTLTIAESRFSVPLNLQADLILIKSERQYLSLFMEGSWMIHKPAKWVHQLTLGIAWKPVFIKPAPSINPDFKL